VDERRKRSASLPLQRAFLTWKAIRHVARMAASWNGPKFAALGYFRRKLDRLKTFCSLLTIKHYGGSTCKLFLATYSKAPPRNAEPERRRARDGGFHSSLMQENYPVSCGCLHPAHSRSARHSAEKPTMERHPPTIRTCIKCFSPRKLLTESLENPGRLHSQAGRRPPSTVEHQPAHGLRRRFTTKCWSDRRA